VDKIVSLERDLARATPSERINILAPIPGKDTCWNRNRKYAQDQSDLARIDAIGRLGGGEKGVANFHWRWGRTFTEASFIADLAQMPHLLIAGTTGSGKSVCINALIASILFRFTPEELRFIMIDPKVVEMQIYEKLPHLAFPVVTIRKKC
jgi:S-DNA-T family DNA segregation ATPase FtsK/SpoIIIE